MEEKYFLLHDLHQVLYDLCDGLTILSLIGGVSTDYLPTLCLLISVTR